MFSNLISVCAKNANCVYTITDTRTNWLYYIGRYYGDKRADILEPEILCNIVRDSETIDPNDIIIREGWERLSLY